MKEAAVPECFDGQPGVWHCHHIGPCPSDKIDICPLMDLKLAYERRADTEEIRKSKELLTHEINREGGLQNEIQASN